MEKARVIVNGKTEFVFAQNYNLEKHGADLACADECCSAKMSFRKGGMVGGDDHYRRAHFASQDVSAHADACRAHVPTEKKNARRQSIEHALAQGENILLNLNLGLHQTFNAVANSNNAGTVACGNNASTTAISYGLTISVRSVDDFIDCYHTIKKKNGLSNAFVNHEREVHDLDYFVIDTTEKRRKMFYELRDVLAKNKTQCATGFPRLTIFDATGKTRNHLSKFTKGSPFGAFLDGTSVVALNNALGQPEHQQVLRGEKTFLMACPSITRSEITRAAQGKTNFVDIYWKISGSHQYTPYFENGLQPKLKLLPQPVLKK